MKKISKLLIVELNNKKNFTKQQLKKFISQFGITKSQLYSFISFTDKFFKKLK